MRRSRPRNGELLRSVDDHARCLSPGFHSLRDHIIERGRRDLSDSGYVVQ